MTDLVERPDAPVLNRPDTDSWAQVVAAVGRLAGMIAYTEFVPASYRGNEAAVAAAILYGREVGLPPMTSLREIYVLDGRPALYAEAMRGLVLAEGHEFEYREATGATCTARARRRGSTKWAEVTWTLDDARRAELIRPRSNWQKYPRAMLKARATAELCRDLFSDVLHGFRAVEEIADEAPLRDAVAEIEGPPADTSTTVQRRPRKTTPAKALEGPRTAQTPTPAPTPAEGPERSPAPPPLPGEDGYEDLAPATPALPTTDVASPGVQEEKVSAEVPEPPKSGTPASAEASPDVEVVDDPDPVPASRREIVKLTIDFENLGIEDRDVRLAYVSTLTGRNVDTSNDLTRREVHNLIETLALCKSIDDLDRVAAAAEAHRAQT